MLWLVSYAVLGLLALPLALIAIMSLNEAPSLWFPPKGISLRWYLNVFQVGEFAVGLIYSTYLALVSAAVGLTVGTAAAYALVRYRFPGRAAINALMMAPLVVPEVVMGIGLLVWFQGVRLGIPDPGMLFLHCLVVLPYTVRIIAATLQRTDPNIEHAARLLGAPPVAAFLRVTLPAIGKGLAAAAIFALVISFHNFTASIFLVTSRPNLPLAIFAWVRTEDDPTVAALSTWLLLFTGLAVWLVDRWLGLERLRG